MRNGEPTWKLRFGPMNLRLDILTQISFPRNESQKKFIDNDLTEDIRSNGLKQPLEINWLLEPTKWQELRIFKGNQRIQALRNLGQTQAPCFLTIEGYPDNEGLSQVFKKLLGEENVQP